jgi:hypothetical protein
MGNNYKHYFLYPLAGGNIATILAPSVLFSLMIFISRIVAGLLGPYGAVPGLLLAVAVVCFSLDYLRQIVKSASSEETEPPEWKIERIDLEELFRGVIPVAVSLFEALFFAVALIFFISLYMDRGFLRQFIDSWQLLILAPFAILYPVNLLSYGIFDDFIIIRFFKILSKKSILKIFTVHVFSFAALLYMIFLPVWENFFFILIVFAVVFYLSQIWAYVLGRVYIN